MKQEERCVCARVCRRWIAPVCAIVVFKWRWEAANFSSGERREAKGGFIIKAMVLELAGASQRHSWSTILKTKSKSPFRQCDIRKTGESVWGSGSQLMGWISLQCVGECSDLRCGLSKNVPNSQFQATAIRESVKPSDLTTTHLSFFYGGRASSFSELELIHWTKNVETARLQWCSMANPEKMGTEHIDLWLYDSQRTISVIFKFKVLVIARLSSAMQAKTWWKMMEAFKTRADSRSKVCDLKWG